MNEKFKVGDIVSYDTQIAGRKRYCRLTDVTKDELWGKWCDNIDEVDTIDTCANYIHIKDEVVLVKTKLPKQFKEVKQ